MADDFDAAGFLKAQDGLDFQGLDDDNNHLFKTPDGQVVPIDVNKYLTEHHKVPAQVAKRSAWNTSASAQELSPVGVIDRAFLATCDAKGNVEYLKKRFEDVKYDTEKGITVRNKGVWQQVDPSGLGSGDAWQMSKEFAKDVIGDLGPIAFETAASIAGGAAAGTAALPSGPGAVVAAGVAGRAAGAAAGKGATILLGKLAGAYAGTPDEVMADVSWEALMSLGGDAIGKGAGAIVKAIGQRPTIQALGQSLKNIKTNASSQAKDIIAQVMGKGTGLGDETIHRAIEMGDDVTAAMAHAKEGAVKYSQVVSNARGVQMETAETFMKGAQTELSKKYGVLKQAVQEQATAMPKIDFSKAVDDVYEDMAKAGILKRNIVMGTDGTVKSVKYAAMDEATGASLRGRGMPAEAMAPDLERLTNSMVTSLGHLKKYGTADGPKAAGLLFDMQHTIHKAANQIRPEGSASQSFDRVVTMMSQISQAKVAEGFNKAGLGLAYSSANAFYSRYAKAAGLAKRMEGDVVLGKQTFLRALVSPADSDITYKGLARDLAELYGPRGEAMMKRILVYNTAEKMSAFLPRAGLVPQIGMAQVAVGAAAGGAAGYGSESPGLGVAAGLAAMSPRVAFSLIRHSSKAVNTIKRLNPQAHAELLTNPTALKTLLGTALDAPGKEAEMADMLTKSALGGTQ